jgi:3'-phosphoadenosine 5'-phosphosulfate sulfotransferase (PAPS reductase)/FAD synthetase
MSKRFDVALVSGGQDSITAAHYTHNQIREMDVIVYLDTGTGANKNRKYVEDIADHMGLQLWTLRTHENYNDMVNEHGFPGPSQHGIFYISLKERQISKLATAVNGDLHLWTGVRKRESERRMGNVQEVQEVERWTWHAPIHDWSKHSCVTYIDEHDLPKNELWETLGRSADCWCGCYGNPEELIDAEACGLDDVVSQLRNLESEVNYDDEKDIWAHGGLSHVEKRAERIDQENMSLCAHCGDLNE